MFRSALTLLLVLLLAPYACAPVYRFAPAQPFAGRRLYNPYAGGAALPQRRVNLHAHGTSWLGLTNAAQSDAEVAAAYRRAGYDVPVISNYQRISAADEDALPVYEHGYNVGKHHQLAIGARGVAWFDLPIWQSVQHKQGVIDRVAAKSALVALCHPAALQGYAYPEQDLAQLTGYQLLEVVNGPYVAESEWDAALSAGRPVWVIGDDDSHDVHDAGRFEVAWNMIAAASNEPTAIIEALKAGRTYAVLRSDGDSAPLALAGVSEENGTITVDLDGAPAQIVFIGQNGGIRKNVPHAASASYTFAADDTYIRTVIRAPGRTLFLNPVVRFEGAALTPPAAIVDLPMTWTMRIAICTLCLILLRDLLTRYFARRARARAKRDIERWEPVAVLIALFAGGAASPALAQEAPAPLPTTTVQETPFASSYGAELLDALPTSDSVFAVLETMQETIASSRISSGGLGFGASPPVSALGSSITQSRYRFGDVDITDPSSGATPMFVPELFLLQRLTAGTGLSAPSFGTPGIAITLEPRVPGAERSGAIEASTSFGDGLTANPAGPTPPLSRLTSWNRVAGIGGGTIAGGGARFLVAGSATGDSEISRGRTPELESGAVSGFASVTASMTARDDLAAIAFLQRTSSPAVHPSLFTTPDASMRNGTVHLQAAWTRGASTSAPLRLFAGYTQRNRSPQAALLTASTLERLLDGPPAQFTADTGDRSDKRFVVGAATERRSGRHGTAFGFDLNLARASAQPGFAGVVGEYVDGIASRMWRFMPGAAESHRGSNALGIYARDRLQLTDRKSLDVSLRYDWLSASADGAAEGIGGSTLLPSAMYRTAMTPGGSLAGFVGGGLSAYQVPLDALAWGDPSAPAVDVFRWTGGTLTPPDAPPLFVVGGNTARVDPDAKRPYTGDFVIGIDAQPRSGFRFQFEGLARWERNLLGVENQSANAPRYTIVQVLDPGLSGARATDQLILVSNLVPSSTPYGFDNVLSNPDARSARRLGARMVVEISSPRLFIHLGATAFMAEAYAGNRGHLEIENDQGIVGDGSYDPNSELYAYGRNFGDRAFTGKLAVLYRFPSDFTLGAIARYQDGQPFAGFVVVPDLNQGAEAVRAYANGGTRFTYTGTLDVRAQKILSVGGGRLAAYFDVYNLTGMGHEWDERAVLGEGFRTRGSNQPPRTARFGARFVF